VEIFWLKIPYKSRAFPFFHIFHSPYYYNCYLNLTLLSLFRASTKGGRWRLTQKLEKEKNKKRI
jgi:hypothetical protein